LLQFIIIDEFKLICFWLIFTRWFIVLSQSPLFDQDQVPMVVKTFIPLLITFIFFDQTFSSMTTNYQFQEISLPFLIVRETILSLVIGLFLKIVHQIFISAGMLITQSIGFAAVRYFDPTSGGMIGPIEKLMHWTMIVFILFSGAWAPMIKGIQESFAIFDSTRMLQLVNNPKIILSMVQNIFLSSLILASPLVILNLFLNVILGIIARTIPQINVLMVSFIVNIGVGLLILGIMSEELFLVSFDHYKNLLAEWLVIFSK
jgi:flagellar biosynthesis protein FliR